MASVSTGGSETLVETGVRQGLVVNYDHIDMRPKRPIRRWILTGATKATVAYGEETPIPFARIGEPDLRGRGGICVGVQVKLDACSNFSMHEKCCLFKLLTAEGRKARERATGPGGSTTAACRACANAGIRSVVRNVRDSESRVVRQRGGQSRATALVPSPDTCSYYEGRCRECDEEGGKLQQGRHRGWRKVVLARGKRGTW